VTPAASTARGVAIAALVAAEGGERSNVVLPRLLSESGLSQRDRAFATELTYGALRMLRACDWLVGQYSKGDLEPVVRAAARAGAYQLVYMRVPAYAAVSATVAECPPRARPLLNAVLRRIAEVAAAGPVRWPDPGTKLSYPDWVIKRLGDDLGVPRALGALEQMNKAASVAVRSDGYVQDLGSQAVSRYVAGLLEDHPGPVLDVCSAPGGKATLLAQGGHLVVGADIDPVRAGVVASNARRIGLDNLAVVVADGTDAPFRAGSFAVVLVDAPCSGLGVLRRRPDARWRVRPGDVARLAMLQRRLLAAAAALVAPGGALVYSVCTLTSAETIGVDEWLGGELGGAAEPGAGGSWQAMPPPGAPWEPLGRGALLLPQAEGTDGMYLLAMRRAEGKITHDRPGSY